MAALLIILERVGKATRSPPRDAMLSPIPPGRWDTAGGFGLHEALDQFGAMSGPLAVALVLAVSHGQYKLAFASLAVPAVIMLSLLAVARVLYPRPQDLSAGPAQGRVGGLAEYAAVDLHLRAAAPARGQRGVVNWLAKTTVAALSTRLPGLGRLAGETDDDAEVRAVLRQAIPTEMRPGRDVCMACRAAARAERDHLAQMSCISGGCGQQDGRVLLCAGHLRDAAGLAGRDAASLLAWQAGRQAGRLPRCQHVRMSAPPPGRAGVTLAGRLRATPTPCGAPGRLRGVPCPGGRRPARSRRFP